MTLPADPAPAARGSSESRSAARPRLSARVFDAIDIAATGLFGIEGATAATNADLDLLGVVVVGFIVALAGGIIRDVLLGDLPPAALRSSSRIATALAASLGTFIFLGEVATIDPLLMSTLDAIGLALFAVTGAEKAFEHRSTLWVITILGGVAGTGGGVVRDVLLNRTPYVLSASVYGTAALLGALATGIVLKSAGKPRLALGIGFTCALTLRMLAVLYNWQLPRLR